jgi:hypothetical protein
MKVRGIMKKKKKMKVLGRQVITFTVGDRIFTREFLVLWLDTDHSGIPGVDILRYGSKSGFTDQHASDREEAIPVVGAERWAGLSNHHQGHQTPGASKSDLINPMTASSFGQAEMPLLGSDSGGMDNGCWKVAAFESATPFLFWRIS